MIAPNLATMLAFVTTDALVAADDLQAIATERLAPRFNALTVDGTSPNETVLLLASGAERGDHVVVPGSPAWDDLVGAIDAVSESLVSQLIADGEGVTHVMIVDGEGAVNDDDARRVAKAVATRQDGGVRQRPEPGTLPPGCRRRRCRSTSACSTCRSAAWRWRSAA